MTIVAPKPMLRSENLTTHSAGVRSQPKLVLYQGMVLVSPPETTSRPQGFWRGCGKTLFSVSEGRATTLFRSL